MSHDLPGPLAQPTLARSARTVLLFALVALFLGAFTGYVLGQRQPVMHTTQARCLSAEGTISCQAADDNGNVDHSDWTFGVPVDVAWTDGGTFHEGGRPECLPPTGRALSAVVGLTWVEVDAEGMSWREVVSVSC